MYRVKNIFYKTQYSGVRVSERRKMASEERRTISPEELIKEIKSGVWGYGAVRRDNIIKKYGVEAYEEAQTIIDEEVREIARREAEEREKRRWQITCIVSAIALISAIVSLLLPIFLK